MLSLEVRFSGYAIIYVIYSSNAYTLIINQGGSLGYFKTTVIKTNKLLVKSTVYSDNYSFI